MGEQKCSPVAPKRTLTNLSDNTTSEEVYAYDAAGNITSCTVSNGANTFVYDQNNRLISYNGQAVTYDMDGNMLSATLNGTQMSFVYDSANRLISAGGNTYTYNVEDVRVRNLCGESETTYAYNTNGRLSQLLVKTTDGIVTKYVYGLGLIGEETSGSFKTYHFDYRGSTTAITDINGNVTDTFEYDTYGNLISRTGTSAVIFLYNGRDGVVTDDNGLIYMRARYYSPELRRFINADIIAGEISNAATLNRYAYANGNPVSNIDPFGLSAERGDSNQGQFILVLYDPEEFSMQAEDESKYLKSLYSNEVLKIAISSKEEFFNVWKKYSDNAKGMSLIFHGSPKHIWVGENLMSDDVQELAKAKMSFLRLLSCNGGHKDVEDNIANAFKANHNISSLYAMDGNLSFYPRNWYLIGHDYSKYGPRLSFWQSGFKKYASYERQFVDPNVGTGYINVKRQPTGFYLV